MLWLYAAGLGMGGGTLAAPGFKPWFAAGCSRVLTGGVV